MEDAAFQALIKEIEVEKGRTSAHEAICADRYKAIEAKHTSFELQLNAVALDVKAIANKVGAEQGAREGVIRKALVAAIVILMTVTGWMAGQLYQMEPARVAAAAKTR